MNDSLLFRHATFGLLLKTRARGNPAEKPSEFRLNEHSVQNEELACASIPRSVLIYITIGTGSVEPGTVAVPLRDSLNKSVK